MNIETRNPIEEKFCLNCGKPVLVARDEPANYCDLCMKAGEGDLK